MLDLAFVRDHLPLIEEKLRQRGMDPASVLQDFRTLDQERRRAIRVSEELMARRNAISHEVPRLKKEGQDATSLIEEMKGLREQISEATDRAERSDFLLRHILEQLPNLPQDSVPLGASGEDNVEVRRWGTRPAFDFTPKPHWELGESLGILDLERAAKITGARFAVYWDLGATLERALMNFMLDLHTREHGYTEVLPPFIVNAESMYGTGQLPKFEADLFKVPVEKWEFETTFFPGIGEPVALAGVDGHFVITGVREDNETVTLLQVGSGQQKHDVPSNSLLRRRDLYLIPTAEVPVTNLYRNETLDGGRLPISLTAFTPCFRSEAGSYGKDVRGIIRQHQFQKVELVKFTRPDQSNEEHEKLTRDAEEVLQKLGLHYRVVVLSTGDMGFSSSKTYDIEVWLPGQGLYREISSCSNFEAFQARRANIRYRPEGGKKTEFVHTLNGSGLAIGRTWVAIVENYQQVDGSLMIPEVLREYVGTDRITPTKF